MLGRSFVHKLIATCCAPASQKGSGFIFFDEKRSPAIGDRTKDSAGRTQRQVLHRAVLGSIPDGLPNGKGRHIFVVVRRCMAPTSGSGSAANRASVRDDSCCSVRLRRRHELVFGAARPIRRTLSEKSSPTCRPSIRSLSSLGIPSSFRHLSSFIE
eukprot:2488476-Prymnesium_polylepis.2